MDPRLLAYYRQELLHVRDTAAEFARRHPKIAGRLALGGAGGQGESADPAVERLLEGFAFLAARVHYQQDAEYPRFTQHLLELVYPGFLAPTPSMMIVQVDAELDDPALAAGPELRRGSHLSARLLPGERTCCRFRISHGVRLWPLRLVDVRFQGHVTGVPADLLQTWPDARACLRLGFQVGAGLRADQLPLDELVLHLAGEDRLSHRLYEQLFAVCMAVAVIDPAQGAVVEAWPAPRVLQPCGFEDDEALLPVPERALGGYRLLKEYAAMPARYLFARLTGLRAALQRIGSGAFEVLFLSDRADPLLERSLDVAGIALHCTPAINLHALRAERVHLTPTQSEVRLLCDRTRTLDHEIHTVLRVQALDALGSPIGGPATPLYGAGSGGGAEPGRRHRYAIRRRQREPLGGRAAIGTGRPYRGTDVLLSMADAPPQDADAPVVAQLAIDVLATNRDLPARLPIDGANDFFFEESAPVRGVRCLRRPTLPREPLGEGAAAWEAISHLSLNHRSMTAEPGQADAAPVWRDVLSLHGFDHGSPLRRQVEGIVSVRSEAAVRRLPRPGPIVHGRGTVFKVTLDESHFDGCGILVLGAVLDRFIARHAGVNSFTQLVLASTERGVVKTFAPRLGLRPTA